MATEEKVKRDIRQEVTDALIKAIEEGRAPFQMPFEGGPREAPQNAVTGKTYTGGNHIWLSMVAPSADPRWCTYNQAKDAGWQVRKGERGTPIEVWKTYEKKDVDKSGQETSEERRFAKTYTVFHASQIDGIPPYEMDATKTHEFDLHAVGEKLFDKTAHSAPVLFDSPGSGFYQPSTDRIHLPPKEQFLDAGHLYATAAHEIAHSTMHPSRLNRERYQEWEQGTAGDKTLRAKEELRAEMASYMLSEKTGIPHHPENHESYVAGWVSILRDSKNELYQAARDAEKIADYVIEQQKLLDIAAPEKAIQQEVLPALQAAKDAALPGATPRMTVSPETVALAEQIARAVREPEKESEMEKQVYHRVILTHRKDLTARVLREPIDPDKPILEHVNHPRQEISGVLKDFSQSEFILQTEEFGDVRVETHKRMLAGREEELRAAVGKPVDISIDNTGKNLSMAVHQGQGLAGCDGVSILQDHFQTPLRPIGLLPMVQMNRADAQPITGKMTHVHDTNMIELKDAKGRSALVFAADPDKTHQAEIQKMIGHNVTVAPGRTLQVEDLSVKKAVGVSR